MARILLIYIDINTGFFPGLHHGLASLAASVRQGGHLLKFYHLTSEDSPEALAEEAARFSPQLIGFSVTTNQRRYLEKYSAAIYQKTKTQSSNVIVRENDDIQLVLPQKKLIYSM